MKNKKNLKHHYDLGLKKLIIKNALTKSEIKANIAFNEILRRIPGEQNSFIAGNGRIMTRNQLRPTYQDFSQQRNFAPRQPVQQNLPLHFSVANPQQIPPNTSQSLSHQSSVLAQPTASHHLHPTPPQVLNPPVQETDQPGHSQQVETPALDVENSEQSVSSA